MMETSIAAPYILGMSNRFKMVWINATFHSAQMIKFQPDRNWAIFALVNSLVS
jgi:hypothetical protein